MQSILPLHQPKMCIDLKIRYDVKKQHEMEQTINRIIFNVVVGC